MRFKANPEIDYIELVKAIGSVVPVKEYDGNCITLRHDVDHDIVHAYRLAQLETDNAIRSTYYLLPPEFNRVNYYGLWKGRKLIMLDTTRELIKMFVALGHEIGLHSNLVTLSLQAGLEPLEILSDIVNDFKSIGCELVTTASHGDSGARNGGYINYQVFEEMGKKDFPFQQIKLSDFGLTEAYSLKRIHYMSDSGGVFALCNYSECERNLREKEKIIDFAKEMEKPSQVLLHPIWWE